MGKKKLKSKKPASLAEHLSKNKLWKKPIAKDGSCLFRAIAEQVSVCQESHLEVRRKCADYIAEHSDHFKEFLTKSPKAYADILKNASVWGGEVELAALSQLYSRSIVVFVESEGRVEEKIFPCSAESNSTTADELTNPIMLAYLDGNHYDSVCSIEHKETMSFCQSIVFETANRALHQARGDGGDVMYDLDPSTYRNIPLEVYQHQKVCMEIHNHEVAATMQFEVDDVCEVTVGSEVLLAKVVQQSVSPGKYKVLITSQNKECVVSFTDMAVPSSGIYPYMRGGGGEGKGTQQKQHGGDSKSKGGPSPHAKQQAKDGPPARQNREPPGTEAQGEPQQQAGEAPHMRQQQQHGESNQTRQQASIARVPEASGPGAPEAHHPKVLQEGAKPLLHGRPASQGKSLEPKVSEANQQSSPQPLPPQVPRPSAITTTEEHSVTKNSSPSLSHAPARYSERVVPAPNRVAHSSVTSDDFDLVGQSSDDEGACQDTPLSHEEELLRECARRIPDQLETGAWQEEIHRLSNKFQLGVSLKTTPPRGSLRVEEDEGDEWPPLECMQEENKYRQPSMSVTGVGMATTVECNGPSLPLPGKDVVVMATTLEAKGGEEGEEDACATVMVVPDMGMPVTSSDIPLVTLRDLAPPSMDIQNPIQFAASYSLQCLKVYLAHGGGGADQLAIQLMMSRLQEHLEGSKGEEGVATVSPKRLNNEEESFISSFQKTSMDVHQVEGLTSPKHIVTGNVPFDNDMFTHQAFLPDANLPPLQAPPTSAPSILEPAFPAALPVVPSGPHLQQPPLLMPEEPPPFEMAQSLLPPTSSSFMGPMMPPYFPMWFHPHMMMQMYSPQMMPMMPCPPAVLLDDQAPSSPLERSEEGKEGEVKEEGGEEEEKAEMDPPKQPSDQVAITIATTVNTSDAENQHSDAPVCGGDLKEGGVKVTPPTSVSPPPSPTVPLPSLPRRPPSNTSHHDNSPQSLVDFGNEESGGHGYRQQQQHHKGQYNRPWQQHQQPGWRRGGSRNGSRSYRSNTYRHHHNSGPPSKQQVLCEATRGAAYKTSTGDDSSPSSCLTFQSTYSGDQSPSHHGYSDRSYSYPRRPYPNHSGMADQSFDSSRTQITSSSQVWKGDWFDVDNVVASQRKMLERSSSRQQQQQQQQQQQEQL